MIFNNPKNEQKPESIWRHAPALPFAIAIMAGITLVWWTEGLLSAAEWTITSMGGMVAGIIARILIRPEKLQCWISNALLLLAISCVGCAVCEDAKRQIKVEWPDEYIIWEGRVDYIAKNFTQGKEQRVTADIELLNMGWEYNKKKVRVILEGNVSEVQPGTYLDFYTKIKSGYEPGNPGSFHYGKYLTCNGISGYGYASAKNWITFKTATDGFRNRLLQFRNKLVKIYAQYFGKDNTAILAALTLGDKSMLDAGTREVFTNSGTSHILALSGLHLAIILSIFQICILRHIRKKWAKILSSALLLVAIWIFVTLAGMPLSLKRAAWMFTLAQIGDACFHEKTSSINNLAIAAFLILIFQPLSLLDVSFQLSFSAIFSIQIMSMYFWRYFSLPQWKDTKDMLSLSYEYQSKSPLKVFFHSFRDGACRAYLKNEILKRCYNNTRRYLFPFVSTSISAQLGTMGFIVYYFHIITPYSVLANFLVIPAAYILLGSAILFFVIPLPFVREAIAFCMQQILQLLTDALTGMAQWPLAIIRLYPSVITLICVAILFFIVWKYRTITEYNVIRRKGRLIILGSVIWPVAVVNEYDCYLCKQIQRQIIIYKVSRTTAIHCIKDNDESFMITSTSADSLDIRTAFLQKDFFAPYSIKKPTVITQSSFTNPYFYKQGPFIEFDHNYIIWLNQKITPCDSFLIDAEVLIISKGTKNKPQDVLLNVRPKTVVLDNTLTHYYRKEWTKICKERGIPYHDIRKEGAFIYPPRKF